MNNEKKFEYFICTVIILICIVIYRHLLGFGILYGGDLFFPPFPGETTALPNWLELWNSFYAAGMGSIAIYSFPFDIYSRGLLSLLLQIGIHPVLVQKLLVVLPLLGISFYGSLRLTSTILGVKSFTRFLGPLIYCTNTYFLMITYGGQFGVALAYAVLPLVLNYYISFMVAIQTVSSPKVLFSYAVIFSLWTGLLTLFDLRYTYIVAFIIGCYLIYICIIDRVKLGQLILIVYYTVIIPIILTLLYHAFWVVPLLTYRINPTESIGASYTSVETLKFYSFADLPHTLSLLHPNWPENIFGKTYFMQPEFLIIPILAYGIFVFRSEVKNNKFRFESISKNLLFFVPLAIIGAFLAKGTQEPFGIIYRWLFLYFPGFVLFRDPSKFYLLIALSYSVLIPYFIFIVLQYRNSRYKILGSILFIVYWAFVIKDIVIVGSGISVRPRVVPEEYTQVHKFISNESDFSRTFWITDYHRFGENTLTHPAVSAFGYLDTRDANVVIKFLQSPIAETRLRRIGIKYIVIPNDSEFEIFLTRRLYDDGLREKIIDTVRKIPWAVELPPIGNIKIFRMGGSSKRFFYDFPDRMVNLTYNMHSSTHYSVHISNELPVNKIIFSENYDRHWVLKSGRTIIHPQKTSDNLMVFEVDNNMRKVDIYYEPQNGVKTGSAVSLVSLVSVSIVLLSYSGMPHKFKSKKTISKSIN